MESAADANGNYVGQWDENDPTASYSFHNETDALHLLLAGIAIGVPRPSTSTSATSSPATASLPVQSSIPSETPASGTSHANHGPLIGSLVAVSCVLIVLVALAVWIALQRRKRRLETARLRVEWATRLALEREAWEEESSTPTTTTTSSHPASYIKRPNSVHLTENRLNNFSARELLGFLGQPDGDLVEVITREVHRREVHWEDETLPNYNTELGTQ